MIEIDGSVLEGGGQILRNAVSYSAILNVPIKIFNIRAGRSKPGLAAQHLTGLEMVRDLCQGRLDNAHIGSTEIVFEPGPLLGGSFSFDTQTAGSVVLLMQSALPCALFASTACQLCLFGGTNADFAPQIDYFQWVFHPVMNNLGITSFDSRLVRRGFYPKGQGQVLFDVTPIPNIRPFEMLDAGRLSKIDGISFTAGKLRSTLGHITLGAAAALIEKKLHEAGLPIPTFGIDATHCGKRSIGEISIGESGNGIILAAHTDTGCILGADAVGKRSITAEQLGEKAAEGLCTALLDGRCVDDHLQDQLIIFMALADGISRIKTGPITLHTETAIHVAQLMSKAQFEIQPSEDGNTNIIECVGIGTENPSFR